ncbi:hypothetical protein HOU70_gp56 [Arthrobacter phage Liebe]|uniref:Uncharacterized protein n=2 Tax=Arthrobacter virus Liebe TaxID=2734245 RepID=A0A3G2KHU7_9CAUD|nr:hypothetical protein HOU70_gp56 [Arthrobacter phage Liebe]AYN58537.1 hypothetical protein PBI_MAUREEN_56 [Arthrobacter phage Maureen]AZF93789.1 hypothetical protein PBI_LIEBE_56 [Arthrobacter phage Liebe]
MAQPSLGERQYMHRAARRWGWVRDLPLAASSPAAHRRDRRGAAKIRQIIRARYSPPALIHNGRKAR